MHRVSPSRWPFALALLIGLASAPPAVAGSITEDSIIDQGSALQNAMERVPQGATVTGSRCIEVVTPGESFRYRCSVTYTEGAAP